MLLYQPKLMDSYIPERHDNWELRSKLDYHIGLSGYLLSFSFLASIFLNSGSSTHSSSILCPWALGVLLSLRIDKWLSRGQSSCFVPLINLIGLGMGSDLAPESQAQELWLNCWKNFEFFTLLLFLYYFFWTSILNCCQISCHHMETLNKVYLEESRAERWEDTEPQWHLWDVGWSWAWR